MPEQNFSLVGHIAFLCQAASELRDAASHEPDIAKALRHIADQIQAEADDLSKATGVTEWASSNTPCNGWGRPWSPSGPAA